MKRIAFITFLIMLTIRVFSQYDTSVYYNKLNKVLTTPENAYLSDKTTIIDDKTFKTEGFYKNNNLWIANAITNIYKTSDTSYSIYSFSYNTREKDTTIRSFQPTNNGYIIRDYKKNKLVATGLSKYVFPLIRMGSWTFYYHESGKISKESIYKENQEISNKNWDEKGKEITTDIFSVAEMIPKFTADTNGVQNFLNNNIKYPEDAKERHLRGYVLITFVVLEDGSVINVRVLKGMIPSVNEEALRVVKLTDKKWKPAQINGKVVRYQYNIPVRFVSK